MNQDICLSHDEHGAHHADYRSRSRLMSCLKGHADFQLGLSLDHADFPCKTHSRLQTLRGSAELLLLLLWPKSTRVYSYSSKLESKYIYSENGLIVHSGAYIASTSDVVLDTQWQGFTKGLFGSELFMLNANGRGDLFLNTFGAIVQKDLQKDERMIIDNHHIVALSENSNYTVKKFGRLKRSILGGEGLVTEIIGPGSVYFQTKNINDFVDYLGIKEMIHKASSSSGSSGGFRIGT